MKSTTSLPSMVFLIASCTAASLIVETFLV
jgi:hypothetical protein